MASSKSREVIKCKRVGLEWAESQLLLLEAKNIHIDNTVKPVEEEEVEIEDEEEEEEEEEEDWESDEEDEEEEEEEDEGELPSPKRSLADVEGAIPKTILRKLPNSTIRKILFHARKNILRLETENYLYEKTIDKLEAAEREIDARRVAGQTDEEFEDFLKRARGRVCSSESEGEEPPADGVYKGIEALDKIHVSQDSFFDGLSEVGKEQAVEYFREVGSLGPSNYDVMHHKYGIFVSTAAEKMDFEGEPGQQKSRLGSKILESRLALDEKMTSGRKEEANAFKGSKSVARQSMDSDVSLGEDEFNFSDAKRLSVTDRLRFATEEEEEFINRFYQHETQSLKDENSIQVHIEAHKQGIEILMGLRKDFRQIANGATGVGLNGNELTDLINKFRMRTKNQLSVEETRIRVSTRKIMAQKKRILEQLKTSRDMGRGISHIDYEYLLCESAILESEMSGMNNTIQHMKDLTSQYHLVLQNEERLRSKLAIQEEKMKGDLKRRQELLRKFHDTYVNYQYQLDNANTRMDEVRKRMDELRDAPPQPLDYIRLSGMELELESEVQALEKKLEAVTKDLLKKQGMMDNFQKMMPPGAKTVEQENAAWLTEIRAKVRETRKTAKVVDHRHRRARKLARPSDPDQDDDEEQDDWDGPDGSSLFHKVLYAGGKGVRGTMSARKSLRERNDADGESEEEAPTTASEILRRKSRFDWVKDLQRKSATPVYDGDFSLLDIHRPVDKAVGGIEQGNKAVINEVPPLNT